MDDQKITDQSEKKQSKVFNFIKKNMPSLFSIKSPPDLWKFDKEDKVTFSLQFILLICIWFPQIISELSFPFLEYWDGPNYVYAARTLYDIPEDFPLKRLYGYPTYYFACHLPGFPLVIRLFSTICFGEYLIGEVLAIIFCSHLFTFVFRRLLTVYNLVSDPVTTSRLSILFPLRFVLYKSVGASEPLYMTYCYLALIFFKTDQLFFMLLSMWGASITRIEGLSIVGTIGLSYLLKLDIPRALFTSLGFLGTASVAAMHKYRFNDFFAYFKFNQSQQRIVRFPPFNVMINYVKYNVGLPHSYNLVMLYSLMVPGVMILLSKAVPIGIYGIVYIIYTSVLFHNDVIRYALPAYLPALLVGFDCIWSNVFFKECTYYFIPFIVFIAISYSVQQTLTNRCYPDFLLEVCDPVRWPYRGDLYENITEGTNSSYV